MARNLELKVGCSAEQLRAIRNRSEKMGVVTFEHVEQIDTYFAVAQGRLKLRENVAGDSGRSAELIAYQRADDNRSRWSDYRRAQISPDQVSDVKHALGMACGVTGVVTKCRCVGIWRHTRIHLDTVEGLGSFVELETVASDDVLDEDIEAEHLSTIRQLGLDTLPVIAGSYSDLINLLKEPSKKGNQL